jgi:hypothetical protein
LGSRRNILLIPARRDDAPIPCEGNAVSSFTKFYQFSEDLAKKVHNLNSDTLKIMLANTAPVVTNAIKADLTEIGTGNGYSAGGSAATFSSPARSRAEPTSSSSPT